MIIIHGDNQLLSRQKFLEIKQQALKAGKQLVDLRGSGLTLPDLVTSVESVSLFGSVNAVFIEGLFSRHPSKEKKALIDYVISHLQDDLYLWEDKDVTPQLKTIPPTQIQKFDLPKYVFKYLDSLTVSDLHQALIYTSADQVFALLVKHVSNLIMAGDSAGSFPSWQLSKLRSQASKFSLSQLSTLNYQLLTIDYAQKTSSSPLDLAAALELYTLKLLN